MIRTATLLLLVACASTLQAQTTPSAAAESFLVMPKTIAAGTNSQKIRLEAASPDMFASSSSRAPRLSFGAGVTLVDGSFILLSPSEAEASVNVLANAAGTVEVRMTFYSTDGKTAVRQERGTLGVSVQSTIALQAPAGGTASGGEVKIRAASIPLLQTNVDTPQMLGDLTLEGGVNGELVITPPVGTQFIQGSVPSVSVTQGNANLTNPRLDASLATFRVNVINGSYATIRVSVSGMTIDTSGYGRLGGQPGALSTSVSGLGLGPGTTGGSQPVAVVNAHTAISKLEGNQIVDTGIGNTPPAGGTDTDTTTPPAAQNTTVGSYVGGSAGASSGRREDRNSTLESLNRARADMDAARNLARTQQMQAYNSRLGMPQRPQVRQWQNNTDRRATPPQPQPQSPPGEAGGAFGAGGGNRSGSGGIPMGLARPEGGPAGSDEYPTSLGEDGPTALDERNGDSIDGGWSAKDQPDYRTGKVTPLAASSRLYFTDSKFQPLAGVILQPGPAGERESRVWVVMERSPVKGAEEAATLNIILRIGRNYREVALTETEAGSGVFRCDPSGIDVSMIGMLDGR